MSGYRRHFAIVFGGGLLWLVIDATHDGSWPNFSPASFLLYVGGLSVIGFAFAWLERWFLSRADE